jgi:CheY-like chemotaxis protein
MQDLLSIALPAEVAVSMFCDEEGLCALIDPGQMESAILNLCINAGQAINGEGTVSLTVGRDETHTICLSISDDGCGMSPEILRRASEPFFTNRSDGTGTGLGLSMVHGFIHQSGGSMQIESEPDMGTKVVLTLPAYSGDEDQTRIDQMSGSVLVVDDNEAAARYVAKILRNVGMEPQVATNMADGQIILAEQPQIDLLITDLYLDQDHLGWDLIRPYLVEKSDRHAILMSSQLPDHKDLNENISSRCDMISKPMDEQDLLAIIRRQI